MQNPYNEHGYYPAPSGPAMAPVPMGMGTLPSPASPYGMPMPMAAPGIMYSDSFDTLIKNKGLYVKEQVNLTELFTGCEMEHNFAVSSWDPALGVETAKHGKGGELLYMKEVSSCCERMLCGANRSFKIGIVPSTPAIGTFHPAFRSRDAMFSHPDGYVVDRPFKCTVCCLNRPVVFMKHNTIGRFATVVNPCKICAYQFDIHAAAPVDGGEGMVAEGVQAEAGRKWYTVNGTMCQPDASPVKRASLMSAVILLNYLFYDNKKKRHHSGDHY